MIESLSVRTPLPPPPRSPFKVIARSLSGKGTGGWSLSPSCPPLAFFPRRERRPYLLLFSLSGRDNAQGDAPWPFPAGASVRAPSAGSIGHWAGRWIRRAPSAPPQNNDHPDWLPEKGGKEKYSLILPCPRQHCVHGKMWGRGRAPAPSGCS